LVGSRSNGLSSTEKKRKQQVLSPCEKMPNKTGMKTQKEARPGEKFLKNVSKGSIGGVRTNQKEKKSNRPRERITSLDKEVGTKAEWTNQSSERRKKLREHAQ